MPEFDQMIEAVRGTCDTAVLTSSAEIRRISARRSVTHRALGGVAALVLLGGAVTGVAILHNGVAAPPGAPVASQPSQIGTPTPAPTTDPATAPATAPATHPATPTRTATPTHSATHSTPTPTNGSGGQGGTNTPGSACTASEFGPNVGNTEDDAAGIRGFDLTFTYVGTSSCKLAQPAHLYYTNSAGHLVAFPAAPGAAGTPAITVAPNQRVLFSVFVHVIVGGGTCQNPHSYIQMFVRIGGHYHSLPNVTITFPCAGAATTAWSHA